MAASRPFLHRDDSFSRNSSIADDPPMSRLFVICNKNQNEEDFRKSFRDYGDIEDIWIVKDKKTGENKGVCYIKFSKTSEAALALEELNGKVISGSDRPIKVLVAANRHSGSKKDVGNEQDKYYRLFVVTPRTITEEELREEFSKYGDIEKISVIKDKTTGQGKGFSFVKYQKFHHAALAFENCPSRYRAVFADPKAPKNRSSSINREPGRFDDFNMNPVQFEVSNFFKMQSNFNQPTTLNVICSSTISQDGLWRLFDIIPGLDYCQILGGDDNKRSVEATVVYCNPESAHYAKEKLHGLEYPVSERLIVKLAGFDNKQDQQSNGRYKREICSVDLPPVASMSDPNSRVAKRCFIVVSSPIPNQVLKNVFCTMGNLIEVFLLPNKNFGYAKYATEESAQQAIDVLHGAEICGVRVKVMEAEDPKDERRKRMRCDE